VEDEATFGRRHLHHHRAQLFFISFRVRGELHLAR
jgi:hypothetical protein